MYMKYETANAKWKKKQEIYDDHISIIEKRGTVYLPPGVVVWGGRRCKGSQTVTERGNPLVLTCTVILFTSTLRRDWSTVELVFRAAYLRSICFSQWGSKNCLRLHKTLTCHFWKFIVSNSSSFTSVWNDFPKETAISETSSVVNELTEDFVADSIKLNYLKLSLDSYQRISMWPTSSNILYFFFSNCK